MRYNHLQRPRTYRACNIDNVCDVELSAKTFRATPLLFSDDRG